MIPSDYTKPDLLGQYDRASQSIARAVADAGVRRAVLLSSLGADAASGPAPSWACTPPKSVFARSPG